MSHATAAKKAKGKGRARVDSSEGSSLRAHAINFETLALNDLTVLKFTKFYKMSEAHRHGASADKSVYASVHLCADEQLW